MFFDYCDCEWGYSYGVCTAPDTNCPHWQGTFCELDIQKEEYNNVYD